MKAIFYKWTFVVVECFKGKNLLLFLLGIIITAAFSFSGIDWAYFLFFKTHLSIQFYLFHAAPVGFFVPMIAPFIVLLAGELWRNKKIVNSAFALIQSGLLGLGFTIVLKIISGRKPPEYLNQIFSTTIPPDQSQVFDFGFIRNGIDYGWPSGHTAVAVAMSVTMMMLYPKNKVLWVVCWVYAAYIAFGMSTNMHWLSDIIAGGLLGGVIGVLVGRNFVNRIKNS